MCGFINAKEIPRKAFLLISVSLCLANARALELLFLRTPGLLKVTFSNGLVNNVYNEKISNNLLKYGIECVINLTVIF